MSDLEKISVEEDLTWGEGHATHENHARNFRCTNPQCSCDNNYTIMKSSELNIITSVQKTPEGLQQEIVNRPYIVFVQCPECYTQFWWHTSEYIAKRIKRFKQEGH